jgi:hypothetical protein
MNLSKFARIVGLCLALSVTALTAFANPPLQDCSCNYCSRTPNSRECRNFDGSTTTCGYYLAVTLCTPLGG